MIITSMEILGTILIRLLHMAVNLAKKSRWYQVRKYLEDNHGGITVDLCPHNSYGGECRDGCDGKWLGTVKELLQRHSISKEVL